MSDGTWFRWEGKDLILRIRVQPRSSRQDIAAPVGDRLRVHLHAPPVEGEANTALLKLIAHHCGVPRKQVALIRGHKSRDKDLRVNAPARLPEGVASA
jgi:uncharacterized protein